METLEKITAQPVPCDLAREHCTMIYEAHRMEDSFGHVDLMVRAYRLGKQVGQAEGLRQAVEIARGPTPPKSNPHDDDERGILDLAREMKAHIDHHDAIGADRREMAWDVNADLRASRLR
jgi:hypothetical protein